MSYITEALKSDFRDLKIEFITKGLSLPTPNIDRLRKGGNLIFDQKYWPIIKKWKSKSTITGSACLYAFGLLDRLPKDIDLLINKEDAKDIKLYQDHYPGMEDQFDLLGYYREDGYHVDLFHNIDHPIICVDGYNFHHPFEIIDVKILLSEYRGSSNKDFWDLQNVFRKINPEYKSELLS